MWWPRSHSHRNRPGHPTHSKGTSEPEAGGGPPEFSDLELWKVLPADIAKFWLRIELGESWSLESETGAGIIRGRILTGRAPAVDRFLPH